MTTSRRAVLLGAVGALAACGTGTKGPAVSNPATATGTPAASRSETPTAHPTGPATELVRSESGRPEVALTFHTNGALPVVTALLDEVHRLKIPITAMFVCNWLTEHPEIAKRVIGDGHDYGNHTWSHLENLATSSRSVVHEEVRRSTEALVRITGSRGSFFRPSAMHHATPDVLAEAGLAGYAHCLSYSVDSRDNTDPGTSAVVRNALATVRAGDVISLHCGHPGTVPAMAQIAQGLADKGLTAVTASALFA